MTYSDDTIRDYVLGRMDARTAEQLEEDTGQDATLRKRIQMEHYIQKGVEHHVMTRYKAHVGDLVRRRRIRKRIYLLLAVVLMLLAGLFYFLSDSRQDIVPIDTAPLYAQYYEPPSLLSPSRNKESLDVTSEARTAYAGRGWEHLESLTREADLWRGNAELALMRMIALMETEDYQSAIVVAERVEDDNPYYIDHIQWYAALARLKLGETKAAIHDLQQMSGHEDHDHREAARSLLEALR